MTADATVSVLIPLYNHERFIGPALRSVFAQSLRPREVIIVDDGSTDGSRQIAADATSGHDNVVLWSQPNQGAHHAINSAVHRATSDYVAILNSDDLYTPDRLAQCVGLLQADRGISAVCTALSFVDGEGKGVTNPWYEEARAFHAGERDLSLALINANFIMTTSNLVLRRSVFDEVGYFSALRYAHDLDFLLRLLLDNKRIHIAEKPLLAYRIHSANTIRESDARVKLEWAAATAFFLYRLSSQEQSPGYYKRLLDILDQHALTRLVLQLLLFYRSVPPEKASCAAFYNHQNFYRAVLSGAA